nr:hypothetical protein Iba_chr10fCG1440 [Ipomoea batatas]
MALLVLRVSRQGAASEEEGGSDSVCSASVRMFVLSQSADTGHPWKRGAVEAPSLINNERTRKAPPGTMLPRKRYPAALSFTIWLAERQGKFSEWTLCFVTQRGPGGNGVTWLTYNRAFGAILSVPAGGRYGAKQLLSAENGVHCILESRNARSRASSRMHKHRHQALLHVRPAGLHKYDGS